MAEGLIAVRLVFRPSTKSRLQAVLRNITFPIDDPVASHADRACRAAVIAIYRKCLLIAFLVHGYTGH
jgi:hypothetical protein